MKALHYYFVLIAILSWGNGFSQPRIGLYPVAGGFDHPVSIATPGDKRLFIVEQPGVIFIIDSTGNKLPTPFLDIRDRVVYGGERGLLGLAFHPSYFSNGFFYLDYVGAGDSTHISRFSVSLSDPNTGVPGSEVKLMTIYQPYENHKGGNLKFGPDGYLYIGMGDGGSAGDPGNRAQDSLQLLGKMLRIDVDAGLPYGIPPDNPFVGNPHARPEIWALGLRNPWRFSFDRITGDLWIGDVGQALWEEIDFQPVTSHGGENYGWRCYEANVVYDTAGCNPAAEMTFPVFAYPHGTGNGCCVIGGYRYRGSLFPNMTGRYFFADYCSDNIWSLYDSAGAWGVELHGKFAGNSFSTFGEDASGELYIAGLVSGMVYHLIDSTAQYVPEIRPGAVTIFPNPVNDNVDIHVNQPIGTLMHIMITNLQGVTVYSGISRHEDTELDLSALSPGLYVLEISSSGAYILNKLVKR